MKIKRILQHIIINLFGLRPVIWEEFCKKYPVRLSAKSPEVQNYMEVNAKAFEDMVLLGMSAVKYVDPLEIIKEHHD